MSTPRKSPSAIEWVSAAEGAARKLLERVALAEAGGSTFVVSDEDEAAARDLEGRDLVRRVGQRLTILSAGSERVATWAVTDWRGGGAS